MIRPRKRHIKKLRRILKQRNVELCFEDECHFQQHGTRCNMWIPPENVDPTVLQAPTRKSVAVFGAVFPEGGRFASMIYPVFNAESFLCFLKMLIKRRKRGRKLIVVLDNARWHHARYIQPWLAKNKRRIELLFLPPYSPHLNPIERVWKLARYECTHNQYFKDLSEVKEIIEGKFKNWRNGHPALSKLCAII